MEFTAEEAAVHAAGGNLPALAARIHRITARGISECAGVLRDKELGRKLLIDNFLDIAEKADSSDWKVIWVTDVSKCGEYDADFGFGKPEWVSLASRHHAGARSHTSVQQQKQRRYRNISMFGGIRHAVFPPNVEEISMLGSSLGYVEVFPFLF